MSESLKKMNSWPLGITNGNIHLDFYCDPDPHEQLMCYKLCGKIMWHLFLIVKAAAWEHSSSSWLLFLVALWCNLCCCMHAYPYCYPNLQRFCDRCVSNAQHKSAHTQLFQSNTHPTQPPLHMHTPINSCVKAKVVTAKAQQWLEP